MSEPKFGTDGVRAVANRELTPEYALKLGLAAGRWLATSGHPRRLVMARDTRKSGTMLGAALASGLCSAGIEVITLGIAPTPAVSYLVRTQGFGLGAVISASHNPAQDNGIKFFGPNGGKLPEDAERAILTLLSEPFEPRPELGGVGAIQSAPELLESYTDWLVGLVPERLDGLKVAVDAAHGAAESIGPDVLQRLGASVVALGCASDGVNINSEGGATKPKVIQQFCAENGADAGIAFDGDADRAVFSDSHGRLINGDRTIAIWAAHWRAAGLLDPPVAVGTVMSNTGFLRYMADAGIEVVCAKVGDKYVSEEMRNRGAHIGGEQSGHIIFDRNGPTGDGIATALELLRVVVREQRSLADLYDRFENWPQVLVNVEVASKDTWNESPLVADAIREAESVTAGAEGRLSVRASGTQPMVRVMAEARSESACEAACALVVSALESQAGGRVYSRVDLAHDLGD